MAKQSYSIKGTNIANGDAVGNQIEQTVSVDDNILPAPQELAEYQKIDPNSPISTFEEPTSLIL